MGIESGSGVDAVEDWDIDKLVSYSQTAAKRLKRAKARGQPPGK
jgi:hypothetical protein